MSQVTSPYRDDWLQESISRPWIGPLPGTSRRAYVERNNHGHDLVAAVARLSVGRLEDQIEKKESFYGGRSQDLMAVQ
jgi:hypothetical protein